MPSMTTIDTKMRIMPVAIVCAFSAESNWLLVSIQLSTVSGATRATRSAMVLAAKRPVRAGRLRSRRQEARENSAPHAAAGRRNAGSGRGCRVNHADDLKALPGAARCAIRDGDAVTDVGAEVAGRVLPDQHITGLQPQVAAASLSRRSTMRS